MNACTYGSLAATLRISSPAASTNAAIERLYASRLPVGTRLRRVGDISRTGPVSRPDDSDSILTPLRPYTGHPCSPQSALRKAHDTRFGIGGPLVEEGYVRVERALIPCRTPRGVA